MYIWEQPKWPNFNWNDAELRQALDSIRILQGRRLGRADAAPADADITIEMDALIQNTIRTSEIEGEKLDVGSVRSPVARQLKLEQAGISNQSTPQTDALVTLLLEATKKPDQPRSVEKPCHWPSLLFASGPGMLTNVRVGDLRGEEPVQVVSGRQDRPHVHFEAPPRAGLEDELHKFIRWFNEPPSDLDPILCAGIAHLWLVTLHPFDDGNGRVTRAVTDLALAKSFLLA